MGLFLALNGIIGKSQEEVIPHLTNFSKQNSGDCVPEIGSTDNGDIAVVLESSGNTSLLLPHNFMHWDDLAKYLSEKLNCPVFSFHIHDDDLWMYVLYESGDEIDHFNPIPDYWSDDLSEEEINFWMGQPDKISKIIGIEPDLISDYFQRWDLEQDEGKAYDNDEFEYCDAWQMCDFMKRIGLFYPMDENGNISGNTYKFTVKS